MTNASEDRLWLKAQRYLASNQLTAARITCESLLQRAPAHLDARLLLAGLLLSEHRVRETAAQLLQAAQTRPLAPQMASKIALALLRVGEVVAARECVAQARSVPTLSGADCAALAHALQTTGEHEGALALIERARALGSDNADLRYFHAIQLIFNGKLDSAATQLESCLRIQPGFGRATLSRARLRKVTSATQHLDDIRRRFGVVEKGTVEHAALEFAQFKELDDLGEYADAWKALERGNAIMQARVPYDIAQHDALIERLIELSTPEYIHAEAQSARESARANGPQPIFIIGMPRSGTTLLERILGNHSQVASAGELDDFAHQLRWQADHYENTMLDAVLLQRMPGLDYANIGARYLEQTQWRAQSKPFFVDKLPANYFLAGAIHRALPHARILNMSRDPMDVCFSNFKALFGDACAYSYHLPALAAHYSHYARVMRHWHQVMPGRILDVAYADLVAAPEAMARRVLDHCGLPFEEGCIDISRNSAPVATLSTAQVREGIHDRAKGEWRRYEAWFEPPGIASGQA
ncbi:MAG: sulfotransferase [Rudaea sp.]|uniref:tetratricopeptide repeat-containing sulfotransferase family protein n=1 Tax=unclassified Rudaea TaxID=2627037 RepID=UPI0010F89E56|nr:MULTISPECIES: sulfotransferase [unclassified Rudaea]MBN8887274.1 sulfotransferase [Rudaea sp.]